MPRHKRGSRRLSRSTSLRDLFKRGRSRSAPDVRPSKPATRPTRSASDSDVSSGDSGVWHREELHATKPKALEAKRSCSLDNREACNEYARAFCKDHKLNRKTQAELQSFLNWAQGKRYISLDSRVADLEKLCQAFVE